MSSSLPISSSPTGLLLIQLGTPESPAIPDVRRYLREFLSDPRVLDMPSIARFLLLNAIILPFRPKKSAEAYEKIWTAEGSPLTVHTAALTEHVQTILGEGYRVAFGMRYGNPPLAAAIEGLIAQGCGRLVIIPLFPQYASASSGSALAKTFEIVGGRTNVPDVVTVGPFFDNPGFLQAAADIAKPLLEDFAPDHILFSYHGLPESQIKKSDPSTDWCLGSASCCDELNRTNRSCYRAQCFATTRGLVGLLNLEPGSFTTTFQSRLAGQRWIEPHTDTIMPKLTGQGVRRLAVLTPAFTADCLETIEEIGIRGKKQWAEAGGTELLRIPCVNASSPWANAVAQMAQAAH